MCSDGVRICEDWGNMVITHFVGVREKQASHPLARKLKVWVRVGLCPFFNGVVSIDEGI
jgi:hypothetical protein